MREKTEKVKDKKLWEIVNRKRKEIRVAKSKIKNKMTASGISERQMEETLKMYENVSLKEKIIAVDFAESAGGYCPHCSDKPIDRRLLDELDLPYCRLCALFLIKYPQKKKEFTEKKKQEIQEIKV